MTAVRLLVAAARMALRDSLSPVGFAACRSRRRHTIRLASIAVVIASSLAACLGRESEITIDNRTTKDVVLVGDNGGRYVIPACGGIAINESDGAKPLDPSASPPPGSVVVRFNLPSNAEISIVARLTITSERIWNGGFPTPPPCEGLPPAQ